MAQMIMKNRKQTVNTGKMFKWDICEKSYEICPEPKRKWDIVGKIYHICPNTRCKWDIINLLFSICPLSIWKVIEHLIFLKNTCKSFIKKMVWKIQFRNNPSVLKIY